MHCVVIMKHNNAFFRYGHLVRHWCMRVEAKHSYFKKMSQNIGNYKYISLTFAKCYQLMTCYNNLDSTSLIQDELQIGPGVVCSSAVSSNYILMCRE